MGFPSRKGRDRDRGGKGGRKGGKPKSNFKNVGSIWQDENDEDRIFLAIDDYNGELYFRDKETDELYKVKFVAAFTPKKKEGSKKDLPENLLYNLAINLANPKAVSPADEDAEDED